MRRKLDYDAPDVAAPGESSSIQRLGIEPVSATDGWMRHGSAKGR
jgi:hypothetical protein